MPGSPRVVMVFLNQPCPYSGRGDEDKADDVSVLV